MKTKPAYCPDWFDLGNYKICETYSRKDWCRAILFRKHGLYNRLEEDLSNGIDKDFLLNTLCYISKNNDSINGRAFNDETSICELDILGFMGLYSSIKNDSPEVIKGITSIFHQSFDKSDNNEAYEDWHEADLNDAFGTDYDINEPLSYKHSNIQKYVTVDLTSNDDKIISDFISFLKNERLKQENGDISQRKTDRDIESLSRFMILPYIDLYLWCKISGNELTQFQMASILFPDEHDVDIKDRLRSVTRPKAMELLDSDIDLIV